MLNGVKTTTTTWNALSVMTRSKQREIVLSHLVDTIFTLHV